MNSKTENSGVQSNRNRRRDYTIILSVLVLGTAAYLVLRDPPRVPEPKGHSEANATGGMDAMTAALGELPKDYGSLVSLGNNYMDQGNYAVAAEVYRRALEIDGDSPDVRTDFGACLHGMGLSERAVEEFARVIREHPEHSIARYNLGIVHYHLKNTDSARFYWQSYLDLDPDGMAADAARQHLSGLEG